SIICSPMTSLKTSIKTITYLSDTGCLEIQGASLVPVGVDALIVCHRRFFASVKVYFLTAIFLSSQTIFYRNPERYTAR
ncbi:hypothetical protein, partial [Escherichia coli]|uniref:hypothetical protein n=1 Tax=Escherichia coli TaxID=562 RepID=UPI001F27A510